MSSVLHKLTAAPGLAELLSAMFVCGVVEQCTRPVKLPLRRLRDGESPTALSRSPNQFPNTDFTRTAALTSAVPSLLDSGNSRVLSCVMTELREIKLTANIFLHEDGR